MLVVVRLSWEDGTVVLSIGPAAYVRIARTGIFGRWGLFRDADVWSGCDRHGGVVKSGTECPVEARE